MCFVGQSRTYPADQWPLQEQKIETFIRSRCTSDTKDKVLLSENTHSHVHSDLRSELCDNDDQDSEPHEIKRLKVDGSDNQIENIFEDRCNSLMSESDSNLVKESTSLTAISNGERIQGNKVSSSDVSRLSQVSSLDFKPRDFKDEQKRHCVGLDKAVKEKFVKTVFKELLKCGGESITVPGRESTWRKGGNCMFI